MGGDSTTWDRKQQRCTSMRAQGLGWLTGERAALKVEDCRAIKECYDAILDALFKSIALV